MRLPLKWYIAQFYSLSSLGQIVRVYYHGLPDIMHITIKVGYFEFNEAEFFQGISLTRNLTFYFIVMV